MISRVENNMSRGHINTGITEIVAKAIASPKRES
jgi:hypothetical protein